MSNWDELNGGIHDLIRDYEVMVEDVEGRDGYHTLSDMEQYYVESFMSDFCSDRDLVRLLVAAHKGTEDYRIAHGQCPGCGHPADGNHWGDCDGKRLLPEKGE